MAQFKWNTIGLGEPIIQECECPHCNLHIAGKTRYAIRSSHSGELTYCILECPSCDKPIIYQVYGSKTYPCGKPLKGVTQLPEQIAIVYKEINTAIGAGCYTAAVILARTAINHIAVDNGAESNKSFVYYVDYMVNNHFVPPNARGWIDKIRQMANESVHDLEIWEHEDAVTIGKFLMYLLIFIYELPASVQ